VLAEVKQFTKQLELYRAEHGTFPTAVPDTDAGLMAQHNKSSSIASMNIVVNKASMTALEDQKLLSFETSTGISLPRNSLYFFGRDHSGWGKEVVFVMAIFNSYKNIPRENQSNRMQGGVNNAYPRAMVSFYGSPCNGAEVSLNTPQSTTAYGQTEAPFLDVDGRVWMHQPSVYSGIQGCSAGFNGAYLKEWYGIDTSRSGGTALFMLQY
jgi:hypothetical protein